MSVGLFWGELTMPVGGQGEVSQRLVCGLKMARGVQLLGTLRGDICDIRNTSITDRCEVNVDKQLPSNCLLPPFPIVFPLACCKVVFDTPQQVISL